MTLDNDDYAVLNAVALKKMASPSQVADSTGLDEAHVTETLARLALSGAVVVVGEAALPTDDAAELLTRAAAERYAHARDDADVLDMADKFEVVNSQFLQTISAWQQVEIGGRKVTNDHSDPDYDSKILDRLDKQVGRLSRLIGTLQARDSRFGAYVRRFDTASDAVARGDVDLVSSPMRDSIHNVWFEFHEDLLRTLGRARKE